MFPQFSHSLSFICFVSLFVLIALFSLTIPPFVLLPPFAFSLFTPSLFSSLPLFFPYFSIPPFCPFLLPSSWPVPQLAPSQIRLIVYQDCERRGRNVLFDSNAKKRGTEETPVTVSHMFVFFCACVCVVI